MSEVKVNKISPRTACGTVTLGDSGDTFTVPSGVTITNNGTQTGFGRTGTVDWDTASIKTAEFTAVSGNGYFVNTTGGAVTVNLPAGSAGDIVGLKDYAGTWDSYAVTINPDGSDKIGGGSAIDPTLTSKGVAVLLVYVDGTQGWLTTAESVTESPSGVELFMVATGGTPCAGTTSGDYKIHKFTGPGTFCVSQVGTTAANNLVSYAVIAGGAGGGGNAGGGGGAGGYREVVSPTAPYTGSPTEGYPTPGNRITVTASPYSIAVGGGGTAGSNPAKGGNGSVSSFSTIPSAGGGGGGSGGSQPGQPGASGGGGRSNTCSPGGTGNTPPTTPAQGTDGGTSTPPQSYASGGGGATQVGFPNATGSVGGAGATTCITASPVTYAGGGGGGSNASPGPAAGGTGGGGAGAGNPGTGTNGSCNTGGGAGGGGGLGCAGGVGGSGIVIIRFKFQ